MKKNKSITPGNCTTPVFVGTRLPAQALLDYLEAGHPLDEFLDAFPSVIREQAIAALEEAKRVLCLVRVLLDECVPRTLKRELPGHDVRTVNEMGWSGTKNGPLLSLTGQEFDIFLTVDQGVEY